MSWTRVLSRGARGVALVALLCCAFVQLAPLNGALAQAVEPDPREIEARKAFATGAYREAVELFAALYAEDPHPNYLHNIGRCYQNLREWDRALSSFRDYLRRSPELSDETRKRVEGYIHEIESEQRRELEARQAQADVESQRPKEAEAAHTLPSASVGAANHPAGSRTEAPVASEKAARWTAPLAWSLVAAGGVMLGVGTYFGIASVRAYDDADRTCPSHEGCDPDAIASRRDAERWAWTSNATVGLGLVSGAAGAVLLWREARQARSKRTHSTRAGFRVGPRGAALQLTGAF